MPISVETFGVWGEMGMKLIKELGKMLIQQSGEKRSTSFLFQSISVAIQRGNALSIMGTVEQDSGGSEEIFLL